MPAPAILVAIAQAATPVVLRALTTAGVADEDATAAARPVKTLRKVNAAGWGTAGIGAVIGSLGLSPTGVETVTAIHAVIVALTGASTTQASIAMLVPAIAAYGALVRLVGWWVPEPDTTFGGAE